MGRATVPQVVAINRCHYHVLKPEARHRVRDTPRLVWVERTHLAMSNRAVRAIACAHVAHQHEGRGAMRETLADIGTARFLADGVQLELRE